MSCLGFAFALNPVIKVSSSQFSKSIQLLVIEITLNFISFSFGMC